MLRRAPRKSKFLSIIAIQTYGDLVNFHPHLHALVTDGTFTPTGMSRPSARSSVSAT
jgi:hypothetical protein